MAILRRGKPTRPHRPSTNHIFTRIDGSPIRIPFESIVAWDEIEMTRAIGKIVIVHHDLSSTNVRESFDAIEEMVNGKAVQA